MFSRKPTPALRAGVIALSLSATLLGLPPRSARADSFAYDGAGRLASATVGGVTTTFAYDGTGALVAERVGAGPATELTVDDSSMEPAPAGHRCAASPCSREQEQPPGVFLFRGRPGFETRRTFSSTTNSTT